MAQKFSARQGWTGFGPNDIITEDEFGRHANTVYYPGIDTCTSITVRGTGGLFGAHVTTLTTVSNFGRLMERIMGEAGVITRICFVGNLRAASDAWKSGDGLDWPAQADTIRDMLGIGGVPVSYANISGTWVDVQVATNGAGFSAAMKPRGNPFDRNDGWQNVALTAMA